MAVLYESTRVPTGFVRVDVGKEFSKGNQSSVAVPYPVLGTTRNGARASALSMYTIVENEHWLATADCPTVQFFEAGADSASAALTPWTNETRTVEVTLPPYCRWVEFYFLAYVTRDTAQRQFIQIDSSVHSVVNDQIPFGSLLPGGKTEVPYVAADWVTFSGVDVEESGAATALRIYADATQHDRWGLTTVDVTVSEDTQVYAAAYRVVSATSPLQYQT